MFTYELKAAIVETLKALPEVEQVNYVHYWEEHTFFVVLSPHTEEMIPKAETVVQGVIQRIGDISPNRVRFRYFPQGVLLPSSATLYRRQPATGDGPAAAGHKGGIP